MHLHIGKNIIESQDGSDVENIEDLAELIDREIILNYKLWPSNYIAAQALGLIEGQEEFFEGKENLFLNRFKDLDNTTLEKALEMYASPLQNFRTFLNFYT